MKIRRINKDSYGWHQPKDFLMDNDIMSKNGKILDIKSQEGSNAFRGYREEFNKTMKVGDQVYKKTKSGNSFRVRRHSKNPFKDGIGLDVYTNKERDILGRKMPISTSSGDSVKAFKEYLKLKDSIGINEKIDNKEIKDAIRKVAKKKAIQRGVITGGAITAGAAGIGYGIKKAIDKNKKKKEDK